MVLGTHCCDVTQGLSHSGVLSSEVGGGGDRPPAKVAAPDCLEDCGMYVTSEAIRFK